MRLQERRVPCPLICPLCNQHNEDDWHVFLGCEVSIQDRQVAGLTQAIASRLVQTCDIAHVILDICSTETKEIAGNFAMMLWVLWNNRNDWVWNNMSEPGTKLVDKARYLWADWFSITQVQQNQVPIEQHQQVIHWQKPLQGWYKCNVDAVFHKEQNMTSFGWCLRDDVGRFIKAETAWMIHC
ncbi:replication protein A 70 kDa DNA-binding subunit [Trifolium pratense]|uniref:Replication protein A 70 kDa DNA-binding subunit n=1 Tax=Trifolium pratense TaxID=57577 RepID=A0A2K3L2Z3_TRIPR|nr:replication protein A 70 kDa DNA-binding subunit [Trifolium pratense]